MKFAERLSILMLERGMNKLSLGKAIGISDRVVGSWVKGENGPKLENASTVADFFGVSIDYLAGRSDIREVETKKEPVLELSENGREMLKLYEQLSDRDQLLLLGRLQEMVDPLSSENKGGRKATGFSDDKVG